MCCGWIGLDGKEGCGRGIGAMICSVDTLEERSDGLHHDGIHVSFIYENKALKLIYLLQCPFKLRVRCPFESFPLQSSLSGFTASKLQFMSLRKIAR